MATKMKIKKGDTVKVIAGDDKGKEAKVLQVLPKTAQVVVEGCKVVKKPLSQARAIQRVGSTLLKSQSMYRMWLK